MKISRNVHFEAQVSDLLFFWMIRTGIEYDDPCEELGTYWMSEFTFDKTQQLLILESMGSIQAEAEFDELCAEVNKHSRVNNPIGSIEINPEHPQYHWEDVVTYDGPEFTFEKFVESQNVQS